MDEKIRKAIEEVMQGLSAETGDEIWPVEIAVRAGGRKIEVTVDTDRGIVIDLCAKLSRRIRERLESDADLEPLAGGEFDLMVSSPGIGEPVRVDRQYRRHVGRLFKVIYLDAEEERRELTGRLVRAELEGVEPMLVLDPVVSEKKRKKAEVPPIELRLADIVKATVQPEF